ncbi:hypothetical protein [Dyadobacter sp. CY343]|uniref:hypothetical protein n=1 Tax=Dyadobacter sp. CY343 TaxID=2907299 RepID=UPI001F41E44F|nr:hypothetical protein [Dyadobacter sp. CY343]MCE7063158.1 hypothetical protein [Dyadobacter sp. CY343]
MILFDPAHPGELIRETLDGIYEETGKRLTVEQVAAVWGQPRKRCLQLSMENRRCHPKWQFV